MNAILKTLGLMVGVPTLIATVYFGLIASDIYVSESRFAIRSANGGAVVTGLAAVLASPIASSGSQDALVVIDYVHSVDMMNEVQAKLDIRSHYSNEEIDLLARLSPDASDEAMLEYFEDHVELMHDAASGVVTVKVNAFEANMARQISELVIELSEQLVNEMSARMERDALTTANAELDLALDKVQAASTRLTRFRNVNSSLDPTQESSALLGMVANLENLLIAARTELNEKKAFMRDDSAEIITLQNRISVLVRQLSLEKGRVVGEGGQEMSSLIEDYQPLQLAQELAQQQYASALGSLELARVEAQRKKQYLVTFIKPGLPDDATRPDRFYKVITVMIFSLLTYAIGGLVWSAVKDHIGH